MDAPGLRTALTVLADALADRGVSAHIAIVGGGALLLREGLRRSTQDVDVVAASVGAAPLRPQLTLPRELRETAVDVARVLDLDPDWLNSGAGLLVSVMARQDLLRLKLFAAYDEGPAGVHFADICEMRPTLAELEDAEAWVVSRFATGPHPGLAEVMDQLRRAIDV